MSTTFSLLTVKKGNLKNVGPGRYAQHTRHTNEHFTALIACGGATECPSRGYNVCRIPIGVDSQRLN